MGRLIIQSAFPCTFSVEEEKRCLWGPSCWNKPWWCTSPLDAHKRLLRWETGRKGAYVFSRWILIRFIELWVSKKKVLLWCRCALTASMVVAHLLFLQNIRQHRNTSKQNCCISLLKNTRVRWCKRVPTSTLSPFCYPHFFHDTSPFLSKTPALPSCRGVMGEIPLRVRRAQPCAARYTYTHSHSSRQTGCW